MSDDLKKYLKQLEQFQKRMNKLYEPLRIQSQILEKQFDTIKEPIKHFSKHVSAIESSLAPAIEALQQQKELINQMMVVNSSKFADIQNLHLNLEYLVNSRLENFHELVPDSLYNSLLDLDSEFEKVPNYRDGSSEIQCEITVKNHTDGTLSQNNMTWDKYITILIMVVQLLMQYQDGITEQKRHEERLAAEQLRHEEIMAEERKQTELQKRMVEIQEQKIQEQNLIENQLEIIHEKIDVLINQSLNTIIENPSDQVEDSND